MSAPVAPTPSNRTPVPYHLVALALSRLDEAIQKRLRHWGDGAFQGPHEAMGVLQEEVYESWDAVRANQPQDLSSELMDVSVAAVFGIASLWATGRVPLPGGYGALTIAADSREVTP